MTVPTTNGAMPNNPSFGETFRNDWEAGGSSLHPSAANRRLGVSHLDVKATTWPSESPFTLRPAIAYFLLLEVSK